MTSDFSIDKTHGSITPYEPSTFGQQLQSGTHLGKHTRTAIRLSQNDTAKIESSNRRIIGDLFDIIYNGAYDFADAPLVQNAGYDYESVFLDGGDKPGRAKPFAISAISILWLMLLGLILRFLNINTAAMVVWSLAAVASAFVLIGFLYGKVRGHRLPL